MNAPRSMRSRHRNGSVVIVVMWAIAISALITTSVQLFAHRQATLGRETMERVRARWAARAGIEQTFAVMRDYTERPESGDALALVNAMGLVAQGDTGGAAWDIRHNVDGRDVYGPLDEHSRLNLNSPEQRASLAVLEDMTFDIYDSISDWIDADDDASTLGVERDWYQGQNPPYEPRNGPLRSTPELELIAGVWPQYFRGEDTNLDNRLDPNENDGARAFPPDNEDGWLNCGWAGAVTVYSTAGGATVSGEPRILLKDAEVTDLVKRLGVSDEQAQYLIDFGRNPQNRLEQLLIVPQSTANTTGQSGGRNSGTPRNTGEPPDPNSQGGQGQGQNQPEPVTFTDKQLRAILDETCIIDPYERPPGLMNINTVSIWLLRDILYKGLGLDDAIADEILYMRTSRVEGILSMQELQKIPQINQGVFQQLINRFGTTSNVYTISSKGRSWASGVEVEIIAVVDRSSIPVRILSYREQ